MKSNFLNISFTAIGSNSLNKDIWNIEAKFGENKYIKYTKVYISFKATLSAFHCFLFHKNIPNTFEVIALLLKADTIFGDSSVNFCLV